MLWVIVFAAVAVVWLGGTAVVGYIARQRGRSVTGLTLTALVVSPLVGYLIALALPTREPVPYASGLPGDDFAVDQWVTVALVVATLVVAPLLAAYAR
jgi:hypothetical protein